MDVNGFPAGKRVQEEFERVAACSAAEIEDVEGLFGIVIIYYRHVVVLVAGAGAAGYDLVEKVW